MCKITNRNIDALAIWFLTGVLAFCCVLNVMPAVQGTRELTEERFLEIELDGDNLDESDELGFAVHFDICHQSLSPIWQRIQFAFAPQPEQVRSCSHLVRGPPRC